LTRMRVLAAVMGFAGILIITRPWEFGISFGVTMAALSAVAFAWTTLMTKKIDPHRNRDMRIILPNRDAGGVRGDLCGV